MMATSQQRVWFYLILLAHLLLALLVGLAVPLGEAPDEVDHYAYARHLMIERRLPVGPQMTQGKHPPLYYILVALAAGGTEPTFDFIRANPDFCLDPECPPNLLIHTSLESFPYRDGPLVMHIARAISAALSTITVWSAYSLARVMFPGKPAYALGVAGITAFVPCLVLVGGAVSNDSLAAASSALVLLLTMRIVKSRASVSRALGLGLVMGLGLLAKVGTLAVWPAAVLGLAWAALTGGDVAAAASPAGQDRRSRLIRHGPGHAVALSILAVATGLLVASPWLARNWIRYGDPLGWNLVRRTVDLRQGPLAWSDLWWLVSGWFTTWWGRPGGAAHLYLPPALYGVLGLVVVISFTGLLKAVIRRLQKKPAGRLVALGSREVAWAALLLTVVATVLSVIRYSALALGTDQARLLAPAFVPLSVLLFFGLAQWVPATYLKLLTAAVSTLALGFCLFLLAVFIRPAYAQPTPVNLSALEVLDPRGRLVFENGFTLVGTPEEALEVSPGDDLALTLYWEATRNLDADLRIELWLVGPDGLVASTKRPPLSGRFSTDLWPEGNVYADVQSLQVPEWLPAGQYALLVGVREFPSERWVPLADGDATPQRFLVDVTVRM